MKRSRGRGGNSDLVSIRDIDKLAKTSRRFISVIGGGLALVFGWLTFRDLPIAAAIASTQPEYVRQFVLVAYYFSWVFGTSFDVSTQQAVYIRDPQRGRMPGGAFLVVLILFAVAAILLWANENDTYFAGTLTGFVVVNVVSFWILLRRVRPIISASHKAYEERGDFFGLELLRIVTDYIAGKWQWLRFVAMGLLILAADIVCFNEHARQLLGVGVQNLIPSLPAEAIAPLLTDMLLFLFVLVAEGWIWTLRVRTKTSMIVIENLNERYVLRPLAT
jgi:hypothetical protein